MISKFKHSLHCYVLFYCIAMIILHSWQYVKSDYRIEPLVRIIGYFISLLMLLFIKDDKHFFLLGYFVTLSIMVVEDFTYYMAFWFCVLCITSFPKKKLFFIFSYIFVIGIVATLHHKNPSHLYIHFMNCGMMFFLNKQNQKINIPEEKKEIKSESNVLNLTNDERIIIKELCSGKQQKDIPGFNKNTVSKKLQAAKERNKIVSLSELQYRFLKESE